MIVKSTIDKPTTSQAYLGPTPISLNLWRHEIQRNLRMSKLEINAPRQFNRVELRAVNPQLQLPQTSVIVEPRMDENNVIFAAYMVLTLNTQKQNARELVTPLLSQFSKNVLVLRKKPNLSYQKSVLQTKKFDRAMNLESTRMRTKKFVCPSMMRKINFFSRLI